MEPAMSQAKVKALEGSDYVSLDAAPLQSNCWGVYNWGSDRNITRDKTPNVIGCPVILKWDQLEPTHGDYKFEKLLGQRLKKALQNNHFVFVMIWVNTPAGGTPQWVFDKGGVPKVMCYRGKNPLGKKEKPHASPYYLHDNYKKLYYELIARFGKYIAALPDELHNRIIYVQVCEGSTGDGQPYKGKPMSDYKKNAISRQQWSVFRLAAWEQYKKHLIDLPKRPINIVVNSDANGGKENEWMMKNLKHIGVKQGMFSHGWHISHGAQRRSRWFAQVKEAELAGKQTFVRGEEDGEMFVYGRMTKNIPRGLYTSALYCLYNGVDCWNVPSKALAPLENQAAFIFFNKYAGKRDPRNAPAAFCALREGLDAADTKKFPVGKYGAAKKSNIKRYLEIAAAYAKYGARQGDPDKATGGGMVNRKRMDYNDVGWGINTGNYYRFLEQLHPSETSSGWWHQGPEKSIYSQFGRSFQIKGEKGYMYFRLDPYFYNRSTKQVSVKVRVVYLDRGKGSWSLLYARNGKSMSAYTIVNTDSGQWKEKSVVLNKVTVSGHLSKGADFILQYEGGKNTIFHMVEVDRR
jgi:hypothetical protein